MRLALVVVAAAALTLIQPLSAGPIRYVETGQLSGTLGGVGLTNVSFTFTFFGDTANITGSNPLLNQAISNTIVVGASNGFFTTPVETGVNSTAGIIGFADLTQLNGITLSSAGAIGYNLAAPISVSGSPFSASGSLGTSLGTLSITSAQNLNFTATAGVPEPGTLGLSALALIGVLLLGRANGNKVE